VFEAVILHGFWFSVYHRMVTQRMRRESPGDLRAIVADWTSPLNLLHWEDVMCHLGPSPDQPAGRKFNEMAGGMATR